MDARWQVHNLHLESIEAFETGDPTLRKLQGLPLIHEPRLLTELPLDTEGIYTLGGGRQVGKTTFLKQLMLRLLKEKGVPPASVFYLSGELIRDGEDFHQVLRETIESPEEQRASERGFRWILLDEITYVPEWDRYIKFAADAGLLERTFVLLTGSDLILIQDAMKRLPGRRGSAAKVDYHFHPLDFLEYCRLRSITPQEPLSILASGAPGAVLPETEEGVLGRLEEGLESYLVSGGYMTAINDLAMHDEISPSTLRTYADWVRGDVIKQGKSEAYLREVLGEISKRYGTQVTWNALSREMSIDHPMTVADYVILLERMEAAFVLPALREDKLTAAPKKAKKIFFTDPFIHHALRAWLRGEEGEGLTRDRVLLRKETLGPEAESVLGAHLRRAYPTFYIKAEGEVDVAYVRDGRFWPIEVKWTGQLRPKDLKQIRKYENAIVASRVQAEHRMGDVVVLPLPVVLLRVSAADEFRQL